jgi:hypothetical protein
VSEDQAGDEMGSLGGWALELGDGGDKAGGEDEDFDGGVGGYAKGAVGVVLVWGVGVGELDGGAEEQQQYADQACEAEVALVEAAEGGEHSQNMIARQECVVGFIAIVVVRRLCVLRRLGWVVVVGCCVLWAQAAGQRLILKDGSYQIVTKYEVVGDRVRYQSAERGNAWEEIPYALVDWGATKDWARAHAAGASDVPGSRAEGDAATIDKEASAERTAEAARQPVVAAGLRLPDESGVWALDTFRGTPELVRVGQSNGNLNRATGHTVLKAAIPTGGAKELIQIPGARAGVQLHVNDAAIYVSVDGAENPAPDEALVVNTGGESQADKSVDKRERSDPRSRYAIVRVRVAKNMRTIGAMRLSLLGRPSANEDIVPMKAELMPGGHWLKLTPVSALGFGEYALVELLAEGGVNLDCWDFGVDPRAPENKHAFSPLVAQPEPEP